MRAMSQQGSNRKEIGTEIPAKNRHMWILGQCTEYAVALVCPQGRQSACQPVTVKPSSSGRPRIQGGEITLQDGTVLVLLNFGLGGHPPRGSLPVQPILPIHQCSHDITSSGSLHRKTATNLDSALPWNVLLTRFCFYQSWSPQKLPSAIIMLSSVSPSIRRNNPQGK